MAVDNVFEGGVVQLYTTGMGAAVNIGGITAGAVNTGTEVEGGPSAGELYSSFVSMRRQRVGATFTTRSLEVALDEVGAAGIDIDDTSTLTGFHMYTKQRDSGGSYTAGSTHDRYTITHGLLVPRTLEAGFGEEATITYEAFAVYNDSTAPLLKDAGDQAYPATAVEADMFTLYGISIGGNVIDQATRVTIDFGIDVEYTEGATANVDELIWPQFVSIRAIEPTVSISGNDTGWFASVPLAGDEGAHADTFIKLVKMKDKSTFHAANESEHIKITAACLAYNDVPMSFTGKDVATSTVMARCQHDGSNAPLVIATDTTIT
jgi:hypothetical protein